MGTHYHQLTPCERNRIEALLKTGKNQSEIAFALGRNKGTISREIRRNGWLGHYYFSHTAQICAKYRSLLSNEGGF